MANDRMYNEISKDTDDVLVDLSRLSNKYSLYQSHDNAERSDEVTILVKNMTNEIKQLKQQIIDLSVTYNKKIEDLKIKHKKDLLRIHSDYVKRINQNNTTTSE